MRQGLDVRLAFGKTCHASILLAVVCGAAAGFCRIPGQERRIPHVECPIRRFGCLVPPVEWLIRSVECHIPHVERVIPAVECRIRSVGCPVPSVE